jgi:hypothetical protein
MMMSLLLQRGAQLIPPDDDGDRAPLVGSPVGRNVCPECEAAYPAPNFVLAPNTAPKGATRQQCGKTNSTLQPCGDVVLMAN